MLTDLPELLPAVNIMIMDKNQEFSPVDIIPLCFSILIYHPEDEQEAHW
jgi:hypothetical protein